MKPTTLVLAALAIVLSPAAVHAVAPDAAALKGACAAQYQAIVRLPADSDGLSAQEREASIDEIIGDTLASSDEELHQQASAHGDVWQDFSTCASTQVLKGKSTPLGLRNAPLMPSNGEVDETAEAGEDVLARWRRQLTTKEGAPKHVAAKEASQCVKQTPWKADNPANFEYGLVYNGCDQPIQVAYCVVGVDCEANKGSIRTLAPLEASRFGDREHKLVRAYACFGKIHPIGQLTDYVCE